MFARATRGLLFVLGTAGAASAQVPLPPIPDIEEGVRPLPQKALPIPEPKPDLAPPPSPPSPQSSLPELGKLPQRTNAGIGKLHSAFDAPGAQPKPTTPMTQPPAGSTPNGAGCAAPGCGNPCDPCQPCCTPCCYPPARVWMNMEWLYWATSGQSLPPLVTTAPPPGTGALVPGATVLFGNSRVNNDFRNGFRVTGGIWIDQRKRWGLEGDFFFLGDSQQSFIASSTGAAGTPLLARPFFNVITGLPDSQLVAAPGLSGTVTVTPISSVIGGGVNLRRNLCCNPCGRVDLLMGFRYMNVTDDLTITEDLLTTAATPLIPAGFRFQIRDHFRTENNFYGGVLGISAEQQFGWLYVGLRASAAIGGVNQVVFIDGTTVRTPPGGVPTTFTGGLLALPSNIGRYEQNKFAVLPEFGLKLGIQLTDHLMIYGGYNIMYLSDVARAGDQIDLRVNPNQLPPPNGLGGPALPAFPFKTTDFWVQGVSAGLQIRNFARITSG